MFPHCLNLTVPNLLIEQTKKGSLKSMNQATNPVFEILDGIKDVFVV